MTSWALVGYGDDPIPDDPAVVTAQVEHIRAVAADLAAAVESLPTAGQVDSIEWRSDASAAPDHFKAAVRALPQDLTRLHLRYVRVGEAMARFGDVLVRVKAQARANLAAAEAAERNIEAAKVGVAQMREHAAQAAATVARLSSASAGGPAALPAPWPGPDWNAARAESERRLAIARTEVDAAVRAFRLASAEAARAVIEASHDGMHNHRDLWGALGRCVLSADHWVDAHVPLRPLSAALNRISAVAGVVALGCSWIPVVGEAVDAAAGAVMTAAAAAALLCDAVTELNAAYEGNLSWQDFAEEMSLDLVNVVVARVGTEANESGWGRELASSLRGRLSSRLEWGDERGVLMLGGQRHTADQEALIELAKVAKRTGGVTMEEGRLLADWADELGLTGHGPAIHPGRGGFGGRVIHVNVGTIKHIPIR